MLLNCQTLMNDYSLQNKLAKSESALELLSHRISEKHEECQTLNLIFSSTQMSYLSRLVSAAVVKIDV